MEQEFEGQRCFFKIRPNVCNVYETTGSRHFSWSKWPVSCIHFICGFLAWTPQPQGPVSVALAYHDQMPVINNFKLYSYCWVRFHCFILNIYSQKLCADNLLHCL